MHLRPQPRQHLPIRIRPLQIPSTLRIKILHLHAQLPHQRRIPTPSRLHVRDCHGALLTRRIRRGTIGMRGNFEESTGA